MYQVSIFNNNIETVVHYPSANQEDPHIPKLPLKEGLSVVDTLSFSLYPDNQGYDKVLELTTKIKITDLRDNTIRFTGRILDISEKMDGDGKIYKDITCEGALSYLNDTKQRNNTYYESTVTSFLTNILGVHNSKVESSKRIQVGTINVSGYVLHTCNFKTTLAEILEIKEQIGGDIRIRETNGILYLDWLDSFDSNTLEISLGVNMKDMVISKDVASIGSRIIPLGANNLTISSINGGLDYIEELTTKSNYGVIEKTIEYKDIEDASTLKATCIADLPKYTQPSYVLESNALDLSYLSGNKSEQFVLGTSLHIVNRFMGINTIYKIVQIDLDLLTPYNPKLTIANKPITMSSNINDLRNSSIQNNGVYNNVQIGSAFGIRAVRSDNKVITTMNATEGISIQNQSKKVFSVDVNGNIVTNDMTANAGTFNDIKSNKGTFNDMTANAGTFNDIKANRGTFDDITVNNGTFTDMSAEGGTFDNITATNGFKVEDGSASCTLDSNGITISSGSYTSGMYASDSDNDTAIQFKDDVIVGKWLEVKGAAYFDGKVIIGSDSIETLIDDRIHAYSVAKGWES